MSTITAQDIVNIQATQFAQYLAAFKECSTEVQALIIEMAEIITDKKTTEDERDHAVDVFVEALFPGLGVDSLDSHRKTMKTEQFVEAREELESQESQFAANLERLIKERGLTQEKLADMTGVSQPAISNILNRLCRPQQRTVTRFAEALSVPPHELWPPLATKTKDDCDPL